MRTRPPLPGPRQLRWSAQTAVVRRAAAAVAAAARPVSGRATPRGVASSPRSPRCCSPSGTAGARAAPRSSCRSTCPRRLSSTWPPTPRRSPSRCAGRCRRAVAVARRGTEFHAWVERYFGRAALVDVDDLPGADEVDGDPGLEEAARRVPRLAVGQPAPGRGRGRRRDADRRGRGALPDRRGVRRARRPRAGGGLEDGSSAPSGEQLRARELQLAVYRLAWARRTGVPL